jgi:outer membrane protein assembly factor BamB
MRFFWFILFTGTVLQSCFLFQEKENIVRDDNGTVIRMAPLWSHSITDEDGLPHGVRQSLALNGNCFLVTRFEGKDIFTLIRAEDGSKIWEWGESSRIFSLPTRFTDLDSEKSRVIIGISDFIIFDINEKKVESFIVGDVNQQFWGATHVNGRYFSSDFRKRNPQNGYQYTDIIEVVPGSNSTISIATPKYLEADLTTSSLEIGRIVNLGGFSKDQKDYIIVFYQDFLADNRIHSLMSLYNLSDESWVYEAIDVSEGSDRGAVGFNLQIYNDRVYFTNNSGGNPAKLHCHDILSGQKVWEFNFTGVFTDNFDISEDGILVVNSEQIPTTVGIDANTGRQLWRVETGGTAGPVAIMNGVAYFAGASDGRLNAIDIYTGKFLYRLHPPAGLDRWKTHVAVVPGDGNKRPDLIVASTYTHYMAFPAAR